MSIASNVKKHIPIYNIKVTYGKSGQEEQTMELSSPFTRWFDADGFFVAKPFQKWLASEIPLIGQADPQKKASKSIAGGEADESSVNQSLGQQKYETPKKTASNDTAPPSTRTRKGKSK